MKTQLLKINELRIEDDQYVMKSCLINPEHIISIQSGKLAKKGQERLTFPLQDLF